MRRLIAPLLGLVIVALAGTAAARPAPSDEEVASAAHGLRFHQELLPGATNGRRVRQVAPSLRHIDAWISAVGASVGALDLRGQGHAGDACLTDPRDDQVRVFAVPGSTGTPYPTFELRPEGLRYDSTMAPIGCVPSDVNQDGAPDVVVYYWGRSPVIFLNSARPGDHAPRASDFTAHELVTPMQVWNTTALNVADVDGDGVLDVFVGNYFPDGARVLDPHATDDARMQMQHSMGKARNAGTNRLFLGRPAPARGAMPSYVDQSTALPADSASSWTLATGFQDLTGNGLPDLYVANDFGPDQLLVNTSTPGRVRLSEVSGRRNLTDPRSTVLGHDSFKGMGVAYSYRAQERLPDIYVSNITSPWALQESNLAFRPDGPPGDLLRSELPYREQASELGLAHSGWSWDIKAVDFQNRGRDDLVQATGFIQGTRNIWPRLQEMAMGNDLVISHLAPWVDVRPGDDLSGHEANRLWRSTGGHYIDIGSEVPFSSNEVSRGLAPADVNGDGRYDLLVADQWQSSKVFLNDSDAGAAWTALDVVRRTRWGTTTPLVGASVTLTSGRYERTAQLFPANGHSGVRDTTLHFGLPPAALGHRLRAEVAWRDGTGLHHRSFDVRRGYHTLEVSQ